MPEFQLKLEKIDRNVANIESNFQVTDAKLSAIQTAQELTTEKVDEADMRISEIHHHVVNLSKTVQHHKGGDTKGGKHNHICHENKQLLEEIKQHMKGGPRFEFLKSDPFSAPQSVGVYPQDEALDQQEEEFGEAEEKFVSLFRRIATPFRRVNKRLKTMETVQV